MGEAQGTGFESAFGSVLQEQLGQVTAQLREHRDKLLATQRELNARTTTVRSKDRSVSVSVGARGDVREIKFHTEDYRRLDPARLGRTLAELVATAQEQAAREAADAFRPLRGTGAALRRSMESGTALEELLAPLREAAGDPLAGPERPEERTGRG